MGGATLWARLDAAHVPAAQTVSALPTELLITEGAHTLLIPLLLGGAVAVLVYLSQARAREHPGSGSASATRSERGSDEPRSALIRARNAADDASGEVEQAIVTIGKLGSVLRRADERVGQGKPTLDDLEAVALDTRSKTDRAVGALEEARNLTRKARVRAKGAPHPDDRLELLLVGELNLVTAVRMLRTASENLADAQRDLTAEATAWPTAVQRAMLQRAMQEVRLAARRTESLAHVVSEASGALDKADRATATEFPRLFGRWFGTLGPIDFLRRWVDALGRVCSPGVAVLVVAALTGIGAWIALDIVDVNGWVVAGIAAALLAPAGALAKWNQRMWAAVVALLAVAVAAVAGLVESLHVRYSAWVIGVSLLTIWLTAGAMSRWSSAKAVAWILFAAIAFWSGALGFLRERGSEPRLELVVVRNASSGETFRGFFLGRTSDNVYLANAEDSCGDDACRSVLTIGDDDASCLVFGPRENVNSASAPDEDRLADFVAGNASPCEPEASKPKDEPPTQSTTHFERNLSLDVDLHFAPRRSVVIRRPRRDVSLDFDFDASPRLSLFSGPSQTRTRLGFAGDVLFPFEDDRLTLGARRRLHEVAGRIRRADPPWVYLYGHADEKGAPGGNWGLSDRRARAVRRALVRRHAVKRSQVLMASFGESWPAVCGRRREGLDDPASRVYNRRVEIYTGEPPAASDLRCPRQRR